MNDEMMLDIERLLAEGERLAAEQGRPTIVTWSCRAMEADQWWAWINDNPAPIYIGKNEAEAIGILVMEQGNRLGILLKREAP